MSRRAYPDVALHTLETLDATARARLLVRAEDDLGRFLDGAAPIITAVREEGDEALARYGRDFDGASSLGADSIAVTTDDIDRAFDLLEPALVDTLGYAADSIRRFHEAQKPAEMWMKEIRPGVLVGERVTPIDSVACYSPRGKGSFPSVTLMTTIPAVVAGVPRPIVLTPPGLFGEMPNGGLCCVKRHPTSNITCPSCMRAVNRVPPIVCL